MSEQLLGVGKSPGVTGKTPVGSGLPPGSLLKLQDSIPPTQAGTPELKTRERERNKREALALF